MQPSMGVSKYVLRNDYEICSVSALYGRLDNLQWARGNGAPWDETTCAYAAFNGNLKILQWARANGAPWDENVCWYAEGGRLGVLQWALAHGAPWHYDSILKHRYDLVTPRFRGVAIVLFRQHLGLLETHTVVKKFMTMIYTVLPLTGPLCEIIINYC